MTAFDIDDDENRFQDLKEQVEGLEIQTFSPEVVSRNDTTKNTGIETGDGAATNAYPQWIPIRDFGAVGGLTLEIVLNRTDSHVAKLTATGDITFAFSIPPPALKTMTFILDVTVDNTGGYALVLGNDIIPATVIDNTADARTVIRFTTTDGGVTYYAENLTLGGGGSTGYNVIQEEGVSLNQRNIMNFIGVGVTAVDNPGNSRTDITITGGGGEFFGPWTANHDAGDFALNDVSSIQISDSASGVHGLLQGLASTGVRLTLTSGEKFEIFDNITPLLQIDNTTGLTMLDNSVINMGKNVINTIGHLQFDVTADFTPTTAAIGYHLTSQQLIYNAPLVPVSSHVFKIGNELMASILRAGSNSGTLQVHNVDAKQLLAEEIVDLATHTNSSPANGHIWLDDSTGLFQFHQNGVTFALGDSGEFFGPWTATHDAGDKSLINLALTAYVTPTGTASGAIFGEAGDLGISLISGQKLKIDEVLLPILEIDNATGLTMLGNNVIKMNKNVINTIGHLQFDITENFSPTTAAIGYDLSIHQLIYNVPITTGFHNFKINGELMVSIFRNDPNSGTLKADVVKSDLFQADKLIDFSTSTNSSPSNGNIWLDSTSGLFQFHQNGATLGLGGSPLTTQGDLFTFSTVDTKIGVGANGQVLSANSTTTTGLEWVAVPASNTILQGDSNITIIDTGTGQIRFTPDDTTVTTLTLEKWFFGNTLDINEQLIDNVNRINQNGTVPTSGFINMANSATLAWEASPIGDDGTLSFSANELFTFGGNVAYSVIHSSGASLGTTGSRWGTLFATAADLSGSLQVGGTTLLQGNTTLGNAATDNISFSGQVNTNIVIEEISTPANAPVNTGRFFAKANEKGTTADPFWKDEQGRETKMNNSGYRHTDLTGNGWNPIANLGAELQADSLVNVSAVNWYLYVPTVNIEVDRMGFSLSTVSLTSTAQGRFNLGIYSVDLDTMLPNELLTSTSIFLTVPSTLTIGFHDQSTSDEFLTAGTPYFIAFSKVDASLNGATDSDMHAFAGFLMTAVPMSDASIESVTSTTGDASVQIGWVTNEHSGPFLPTTAQVAVLINDGDILTKNANLGVVAMWLKSESP